jgi:hypothetical protein
LHQVVFEGMLQGIRRAAEGERPKAPQEMTIVDVPPE